MIVRSNNPICQVAGELLFQFGLQALDLSFCSQLTDLPFQKQAHSQLRELRLSSTTVGDKGIQEIAERSPMLEVLDAGSCRPVFRDVLFFIATLRTHRD